MDSIWKNFLPSIIYRKTRSDEAYAPVYGVKLEAKKRGCKKCKRRRRLRERRKRGDRGDDLIDDLGNYLRAFVYSFFFFFIHSVLSPPPSTAYRPIARNEASSFIHHHFFAPDPHPLSRGVRLFHEIVAHTHMLFRAIFFYHLPHLAASPLLAVFSRMDGRAATSTRP